jgi:hypothetical protein
MAGDPIPRAIQGRPQGTRALPGALPLCSHGATFKRTSSSAPRGGTCATHGAIAQLLLTLQSVFAVLPSGPPPLGYTPSLLRAVRMTSEKQSYIECLMVREIAYTPLVTLPPIASEIYDRDLTKRVSVGQVSSVWRTPMFGMPLLFLLFCLPLGGQGHGTPQSYGQLYLT